MEFLWVLLGALLRRQGRACLMFLGTSGLHDDSARYKSGSAVMMPSLQMRKPVQKGNLSKQKRMSNARRRSM
ncbi:hypothetical protein V8F33_002385 [Rhypophila sp. PSN 637]